MTTRDSFGSSDCSQIMGAVYGFGCVPRALQSMVYTFIPKRNRNPAPGARPQKILGIRIRMHGKLFTPDRYPKNLTELKEEWAKIPRECRTDLIHKYQKPCLEFISNKAQPVIDPKGLLTSAHIICFMDVFNNRQHKRNYRLNCIF